MTRTTFRVSPIIQYLQDMRACTLSSSCISRRLFPRKTVLCIGTSAVLLRLLCAIVARGRGYVKAPVGVCLRAVLRCWCLTLLGAVRQHIDVRLVLCRRKRMKRSRLRIGLGLVCLFLGTGIAEAETKYRLPLAFGPSITAWADHWHTLYVYNSNVRYDGTVIFPGSPYYYGTSPRHRGTDFGVTVGTPVYAAASGTVKWVQTGCTPGNLTCGGGLGNWVAILHADGWYSIYAHLSSVGVSMNQPITCISGPGGTQIGLSGNTGDSTGAHLHFELRNGLSGSSISRDPFAGSESQPTEYWAQFAWVPDPLRPGYNMHYPTTLCQ